MNLLLVTAFARSLVETLTARGMTTEEAQRFVGELRAMSPIDRLDYWKPLLKEALVRMLFDAPWTLSIGCHDGVFSSKEPCFVTTKFLSDEPLASLDDCITAAEAWRKNYEALGRYLWFAHAISPDGVQHPNIVEGVPYE